MTIGKTGSGGDGGPNARSPEDFVFEYAKNGVDYDMIGDYSVSETIFKVQPPAGQRWLISRLIVQIKDAGSIDAGSYGNGITLTNGIVVRASDDSGVLKDLTGGVPVFTNADWSRLCYDVQEVQFGAGDNYIGVRWTIQKAGALMLLDGDKNERMEIVLNDNFSALNGHTIKFQGLVR